MTSDEPLDPGSDGIPQHAAAEEGPPAEPLPDNRPEPVLNAAVIAGAVAAVIIAVGGLLRVLGWSADTDFQQVAESASNIIFALAAAWSLVGPWILAKFRARPKVTPLADPRDALGRKLIAVPLPQARDR